ncbi:glucose-1-phosphate adenylyltransferase subunit GlgD [uncultured Eubacterium sp.]|uniref:glucose-1-phosphate adenylyltransferase subunit GlgD n=1 Tax=uncultured Eubacterium sp. TaxID=165185 RepID=UPI0015C1B8B3|nr:glucose-1-phosphate adenylyltransferase subunit GlgD [uncultured Eubacterium sp.]
MNGKNVLGMIFANIHEETLETLTEKRTMGSVPFCSRYRLIDFPLSNMVESSVTKVGVVTNSNFNSLMDHVGTGKPWDLSRKTDGLYLLPPYSINSVTMWGNRIDAIYGNMGFLNHSTQEYVLMSDCYNVMNIDFNQVFDAHEKTGADITVVGVRAKKPVSFGNVLVFDKVEADGRITDASIDPDVDEAFYSTNIILMKKQLLESLVSTAHSKNEVSFQRNILLDSIKTRKVYSYDATDCFVGTIDSIQSYFDISMSILDRENKKKLFAYERPIYTKERDDMPTLYGMEANVKNSLVADGCVVKGTVENCILFKGVQIKEGAVVKNSILMQDTVVGENVKINYIIADKDCSIKADVEFSGAASYPVCVSKGTRI